MKRRMRAVLKKRAEKELLYLLPHSCSDIKFKVCNHYFFSFPSKFFTHPITISNSFMCTPKNRGRKFTDCILSFNLKNPEKSYLIFFYISHQINFTYFHLSLGNNNHHPPSRSHILFVHKTPGSTLALPSLH